MLIGIAGGTGFLGGSIRKALLANGHEVRIISRSEPADLKTAEGVHWRRGDVTEPESLVGAIEGCDALVDAVQFPNSPMEDQGKGWTFELIDRDGTMALVDAAGAAGVGLFVGISGAGAAAEAPYHWLRFKWEEEEHIKASGLPFVIFRPSWVFGPEDVSLNKILGFGRFLPFIPMVGSGKNRITPLFVDDLGAHIAASIASESARGNVYEIGGPTTLSMNDIVRTALRVKGQRRFLLPQPKFLMKAIGAVAQFAPGRPLTPGAVDFVTMDGLAHTGPLEETFGLELTPLEEALGTYL